MKISAQNNQWEAQIDKVIASYWRGAVSYANKQVSSLIDALKRDAAKGKIDNELVQALYRLSDFYCFERQYVSGENLLNVILKVQIASHNLSYEETKTRLARLRYVWSRDDHARQNGSDNLLVLMNNVIKESA
ncbi:MAG: hypothetical protein K2W82_10145 [Candidatus Obscuribacterales bacterium]|nr:hypothetical protein [Candidatus Obscuribacterales bacterium]